MLTQHIALVPEADGVSLSELARVSAALQKQVIRDVAPLWGMAATVDAFPRLEDVPVGYHPIIISLCELGPEAGVYLDGNGHPYAQIELWASWSLDASRACIEMLINPFGNRSVTGPSPRSDQGPVEFLVEACAPCAGPLYAYAINDIIVSDFCTPAFFGCGASMQTERYSFTGATELPFEVLPGGHLTWYDPASDSWWRRSQFGDAPIDTRLDQSGRQVAAVRQLARGEASAGADRLSLDSFEARLGVTRKHALLASQVQAQRLRALLGQGLEAEIVSYGSVPPSRAARSGSPSHRDERLLRSAVSATPVAQPKRDEAKAAAVPRVEAAIEHDEGDAEELGVEVDAAETTATSDTAAPQPVTSKPPPLPASSPAPAPAPAPAPVQYVTGYPQMPAVVFTTPPPPPQQRSGARDTAFLLGGALVAAALIALAWTGRSAFVGAPQSTNAQQAASVAHEQEPPVAAAAATPAPIPSAVRDTTTAAPAAERPSTPPEASGVTVSAPQRAAAEPDHASTQATSSHGDQAAASGSRHHRRHDAQDEPSTGQSPPAPPAPTLSARSSEKPAALTIDDLLDTRR